jgi:dTDP-4-dehydrorhamnose 3,5-epimerase
MKVTESGIKGVFIIEPDVYEDDRGFFMETFHNERYRKLLGINLDFVQDNISRSSKNVLRGMHFQKNYPQGKIVKASRGEILDVVVDLRKDSPTYGTWESFRLSEKNKLQVWIPPGFAHGFLVMSDSADFEYKCTEYYHPEDELCLMWNDPEVAIDWTINDPILSEKDKKGLSLKDL